MDQIKVGAGSMYKHLRQHIEKIIPLTEDEFAFVSSKFVIKFFHKRDFLFRQGETVKYTYFVVSGLLKLINNDEAGKEHVLSFAMEDWWETDFWAFYNQISATMSLRCLEETAVLCLSLEGYQALCKHLPKIEHFFLSKANSGHIAAQHRILSFLSGNANQRYAQLIKRYPSLIQRLPKTLVASYLGVSRETLSRLPP